MQNPISVKANSQKPQSSGSQRQQLFTSPSPQTMLINHNDSLSTSFILGTKSPSSTTGDNIFKKRIADSVVSRLSAERNPGDYSALKVRRKSVKNEHPIEGADIWGGLNTNPNTAKRSGSIPLKE